MDYTAAIVTERFKKQSKNPEVCIKIDSVLFVLCFYKATPVKVDNVLQ